MQFMDDESISELGSRDSVEGGYRAEASAAMLVGSARRKRR